MGTKHDETANRIARKRHASYNRGQGPDVLTPGAAIEVETRNTVADAARQLRGFRKPVYVAGADQAATDAALERYADSTIGVMDPNGKIVKRSNRGK